MERLELKEHECVCGDTIFLFGNVVICGSCGYCYVVIVEGEEDVKEKRSW